MDPMRRAVLLLAVLITGSVAGAQVVWDVFEGNPVISPPESGSWDEQARFLDAVVKVDGVYHLFFNGTATIRYWEFQDYAIGHATSSDGITWEMDPSNPVLTPEPEGDWQVTTIIGTAVIHDGAQFRMWYGGGNAQGLVVGYATSPDGSTWTRHPDNPVMERGPAGSFDDFTLFPNSVINEGGLLKMWYTASKSAPGGGFSESIAYATSTDGVSWTKHPTPVLEHGDGWENFSANMPWVVHDGTSYHMWYIGYSVMAGVALPPAIGYAVSLDGIEWTKDPGNPIEELGFWISMPVVLHDFAAGRYEMFYTDEPAFSVLRATSQSAGGASELLLVPAAAHAAGAEGAFFQTDLDLNNTAPLGSGLTARYQLIWLPRGEDNSAPMTSGVFALAAGESVRYANVLSQVFGIDPDALGAVGIATDSARLIGMSRTYNVSGGKLTGTFGQALPAIATNEMQTAGDTQRLIFLSQDDDFRANVGCANATGRPVSIDLVLRNHEGATLDTQTLALGPWSNDQINRILGDHAPVDGYVDVSSNTADAVFFCYGSMLDNLTSDPTTILPQRPSDATLNLIPAAALAGGSEGAFFQTDVDLNNAGPNPTSFVFQWLPRDQDNSTPDTSEMFTLDAGISARYENVLAEVFGAEPNAVGALALSVDLGNILVMSRTYNISAAKVAGTYGQALAGVPVNALQGPGETRRIIFLSENDDFRSNIGCVNGGTTPITIDIAVFDAAGALLENRTMNLLPWSNTQINQVLEDFAPVDGYVDVSSATPAAAFTCYGSVLDNNTNDPTTIVPK